MNDCTCQVEVHRDTSFMSVIRTIRDVACPTHGNRPTPKPQPPKENQ